MKNLARSRHVGVRDTPSTAPAPCPSEPRHGDSCLDSRTSPECPARIRQTAPRRRTQLGPVAEHPWKGLGAFSDSTITRACSSAEPGDSR